MFTISQLISVLRLEISAFSIVEVMAVPDIKLKSRLSKNIHLSRHLTSLSIGKSASVNDFWPGLEHQSTG